MENASCARTWDALTEGAPLEGRDAAHLETCASCAAGAAGFARLDALLSSEPAPLAPADLARGILEQVAARRRADLARWRRRALAWAAAVVLAGFGLSLGWPLTEGLLPTSVTDLPTSVTDIGGGLSDLAWTRSRASLEGLWGDLQGAPRRALLALLEAPTPPWALLVAALPVLAALHWTIGRGAGVSRGTPGGMGGGLA